MKGKIPSRTVEGFNNASAASDANSALIWGDKLTPGTTPGTSPSITPQWKPRNVELYPEPSKSPAWDNQPTHGHNLSLDSTFSDRTPEGIQAAMDK